MGLHFTSYILEEKKIWLLAPDLSILCCIDKETYTLRYIADLAEGITGTVNNLY